MARDNSKATGKVIIKVGTGRNQERYTARADFNSMILMEDETGEGMLSLVMRWNSGDMTMRHVRAVVWAALQSEHPGTSLHEAGEICQELGFSEAFELAGKIINSAFPDDGDYEGIDEAVQEAADPNAVEPVEATA